MAWLAFAGYSSTSLDALLANRAGRAELPPHPVIVTFDDGYADVVENAVPVLRSHGFTATIYFVAGEIGGRSRWLRPLRGYDLPMIDWATACRLAELGFECGAHGLTHQDLTNLGPAGCRHELIESRRVLEDHLGREVRHMAYPYGSYDESVRAMVMDAGYHSACSVRVGLSPPEDDPLALYRVPVLSRDSLVDFVCRLRTGQSASGSLRLVARHRLPPWAYANARTAWRRLRRLHRPSSAGS